MKRFVWLVGLFVLGVGSALADGDKWEPISSEDGINVWRREVEGNPLVIFKGDAVVDAPIAKVANVVYDLSRDSEWVADVLESRVVELISPTERIEYNRTGAPWPIKDRDFVFHAKLEIDATKKRLVYSMDSIADKRAPEDESKAVRGELRNSTYVLDAVDQAHTRVTVEIECDPKGSIPKWVVNLVQKGWPRKTLEGIRAQAAKADVVELALVADALAAPREGVAVAAVSSQTPEAATPAK